MAERRKLEFFLLRYVPDVVKGEFVNFGLLTFGGTPNAPGLSDVRFARDWERVLRLDPQADVELLEALREELQHEIGMAKDQMTLLRRMEDSFSGVVQISQVMPALTDKTAVEEIENVARLFLETEKQRRMREPTGRQKILEIMVHEFENVGVLSLLNPVPAETYTKAGDPFKFDFGYRFGNQIKLFHAVSLRASVDSAVLLAARYPKIAPSIRQLAEAAPILTAVVEADADRSRSEVGFALEMMEESKIRVAETTEMPEIAKTARLELRV